MSKYGGESSYGISGNTVALAKTESALALRLRALSGANNALGIQVSRLEAVVDRVFGSSPREARAEEKTPQIRGLLAELEIADEEQRDLLQALTRAVDRLESL